MTLSHRIFAGLLAMFALGRAEAANLEWTATELRLAGAPGKTSLEAAFPFRNASEKVTRVLLIRPSCECLSAAVTKDEWAPGEDGEVRVLFSVGGQTGRVLRTVTVMTDEADAKPIVLRLVVDLPEPLRVSTRALIWDASRPLDEKMVEIVAAEPANLSKMDAQCVGQGFETKLERVEASGTYRLRVRPIEAKAGTQGVIRITATLDGRPQVLVVQALVR